MRVSSSLTSRRLAVPALIVGLMVASLLPARWSFYGRPLHNAMLVVLYPAVWFNAIGSRLRAKPPTLLDTNIEAMSDELLKMEGLLRQKDEQIRRLLEENAQLAGLRRAFGESYSYVQVVVIGRSPDPAAMTLLINRGSRHGLRDGMVAVDGPNLVGRVVQVQHNSAAVQPITAPGSFLRITLDKSAPGSEPQHLLLLQAVGQDLLADDEVAVKVPVEVGDFVRLADYNRYNPWPDVAQAMVVGKVTAVSPNPDDPLLQRVQVRPLKPLYHMESLTVIVPGGEDDLKDGEDRP